MPRLRRIGCDLWSDLQNVRRQWSNQQLSAHTLFRDIVLRQFPGRFISDGPIGFVSQNDPFRDSSGGWSIDML